MIVSPLPASSMASWIFAKSLGTLMVFCAASDAAARGAAAKSTKAMDAAARGATV
jgi:hypothetical protein